VPTYIIERHIPGVECMSPEELKSVSRRSNSVATDLGGQIRWKHSYVVEGMTFCVYDAPDEALIREHARLAGFPCNRIREIHEVIGPHTGED
jgi:hypothetical protein